MSLGCPRSDARVCIVGKSFASMLSTGQAEPMGSVTWGKDVADGYDRTSAAMYDPDMLDPTVNLLADLADDGPALELAIGTGRVALPLSERCLEVHGIDLSPHMVDQLRDKPGADAITVAVGDMVSTTTAGEFTLVYLVWNGIMNVTTQAKQTNVFKNAAAHLKPGGRFVVEVIVPQLRRIPAGEVARVFMSEPDHVGIETFDDQVGQIAWSHHWMSVDGSLVHHAAPYRYVWPSELDLMAQLAGLNFEDRWADWKRSPFTSDSENQVVVYRRSD
ncbi:MAG: SAM-dependent methyltransferase [Ilumatobacter sp.]|jgi:SAM-dependent methyltransferase